MSCRSVERRRGTVPRRLEAPLSSRETARRFHFLREIASGGFGTVYLTKVMHADGFSRLVAVKLLKSQWTDSEEVARRMRDEARLLGLLRHRHIVDVMDLTAIDGRAAVVMEYLEAVDLKHIVGRLAAAGDRLPVRAVLEIGAAVASALDAAYNRPPIPGDKPLRVIHRDIKPSNIMLDETGMVKVLDFGVARSEIDNRESHTQDLQFGSVDYMAPERLFFEPETPASDVYSLGATLYELLALEKLGKGRGRPELHRKTIAARLDRIQPAVESAGSLGADIRALLEQSLAYEHESRPTAAEFFQRARSLARALPDGDMDSWAERVLPAWIQAAQSASATTSPLDDAILAEDSSAFSGVLDDSDLISVDGTIGDELRRGALAELEETGALSVAPATGAPRVSPATPLAEPADEERATVVAGLEALGLPVSGDEPAEARDQAVPTASVTEPLPEARTTPVPQPPAPPAVAAARARFAPIRAQAPPKSTTNTEGTATGEPEWTARTEHGRPAMAQRPSGPTLIPDDAEHAQADLSGDEQSVTTMMPVPASARATAAPPAVPQPTDDDTVEGRTVPLVASATASGGPSVNPTERSPMDPPSAANVRRPEVTAAEVPLDPPSDGPTSPAAGRSTESPSALGEPAPPVDEPTLPAGALPPDPRLAAARSVVAAEVASPVASTGSAEASRGADAPPSGAGPVRPKRGGLAAGIAAGCLVAVIGLGAVGAGVALNLDALREAVADARAGAEANGGEPTAPEPGTQPVPAASTASDGPSISFRSDASDTRKLKVLCGTEKGQGVTEAVVSMAAAETCTVTAYLQDRSRRTAAVRNVTAGTYVCFAADSDGCQRR